MKTRNRGVDGYVPTPEEITNERGSLSQSLAATLIYTTQSRWSDYEKGKNRLHPAIWELFLIKRGQLNE